MLYGLEISYPSSRKCAQTDVPAEGPWIELNVEMLEGFVNLYFDVCKPRSPQKGGQSLLDDVPNAQIIQWPISLR